MKLFLHLYLSRQILRYDIFTLSPLTAECIACRKQRRIYTDDPCLKGSTNSSDITKGVSISRILVLYLIVPLSSNIPGQCSGFFLIFQLRNICMNIFVCAFPKQCRFHFNRDLQVHVSLKVKNT